MVASHPHALSPQQQEQFHQDGFIILRNVLPERTLEGVRSTIARAVDVLAQRWMDKGHVSETHDDKSLDERYLTLLREVSSVPAAWRRLMVSPAVYRLWRCDELLGAVRSLVGDEVYAHGVWACRPRDPMGRTQAVAWHQDAYYYKGWEPGDGTLVSVWMPLVPVDAQTGCLQFAAGAHQRGWLPRQRLVDGEYGTAERDLEGVDVRTAVMDPGDAVIFADTMPHRSMENTSGRVRWSIDIRFGTASPEVIEKGPRGYYCFSSSAPDRVESYEIWRDRYEYDPGVLLDEMTNFEEGYDLDMLRRFSRMSPYNDVY